MIIEVVQQPAFKASKIIYHYVTRERTVSSTAVLVLA